MAMNSHKLSLLCTTSTLIIITLIHLLSPVPVPVPVACSNQKQPPPSDRGLLFEGKTRLGSTPPSCHNKCNQCHPCLAVQVPTLPSHDRFQPEPAMPMPMPTPMPMPMPMGYFDSSSLSSSSSTNNKYSNYKPLGWKCRCGGHFFNP